MFIHQSLVYKRAISEHGTIYDRFKNTNLNISISNKNNKTVTEYTITFKIDNKFNLKFILNGKYPFIKPKLIINNIDYQNFLIITNSLMTDIIRNDYKIECLCCNTILCDWSPAIKLDTIIDEFIYNKTIIEYTYNKKKLIEFNEKSEKKLPLEIINKISTYF